MGSLDPGSVTAVVLRSPDRVAAQDRDGWLALFTREGCVEDPVGTAPNRRGAHVRKGADDLARFYDTFIGGNEIRFEVLEDVVCGDEMIRDVVIHTRLPTGLSVVVPAYLRYRIAEEDGEPRIAHLQAVWDLRRRSLSALASGWLGLRSLTAVSLHMFRVQAMGGMLGYSQGLVDGIFGDGPPAISQLVDALNERRDRDLGAVQLVWAPSREDSLARFLETLGEGTTLSIDAPTSAGWLTAFRFTLTGPAAPSTGGFAFARFDPATRTIVEVRFYPRAGAVTADRG